MEPSEILDQLLTTGKDIAERGREAAERALDLPTDESARKAKLADLKKGAAVGGVLALLLGTKTGRRVAGKAVKYGSLAGLAAVAVKAVQNWQAADGSDASLGESIAELDNSSMQTRSEKLIRAMIGATKADGHIDRDELVSIEKQVDDFHLDDDFSRLLKFELDRPLCAKEIAALADSPSSAAEIYLASLLVIDRDNRPEQEYLAELAKELDLSDELQEQIHQAAASSV